jgi:2-polyprenyl-6-methoxyphenol hydroxylase-like FAD-dependent oxidoreductase
MRIAVVGGGPAGLYFAYLWKTRHPRAEIELFEQNAADATFGFGVVFSERALDFMSQDDPETVAAIMPHMEAWRDIKLVHRGEEILIDGVGFSAIGRLEFLRLLQQRVRRAGVVPNYGTQLTSLDEFSGFDLIVGADGVNSLLRRSFEGDFKTSLTYPNNKFIWYGTTQPFDALTQTFVATEIGTFNAHHYRYAPAKSTFIVECDRATWLRAGFDALPPEESRALLEQVFAASLGGHALISNKSAWRNFPWIWNDRWSVRNMVLVGDALHTAHFSIGSGTRLALEDVIALVRALEAAPDDLGAGLALYESSRRPVVEKLVRASKASADWYEHFPQHMQLAPRDFAMSYIARSGRVDRDRLRAMSPGFMTRYERAAGAVKLFDTTAAETGDRNHFGDQASQSPFGK